MEGDSQKPGSGWRLHRTIPLDEVDEESTKLIKMRSSPQGIGETENPTAYLIVLTGSDVGQMFRIENLTLDIGRSFEAKIRLNDNGISRSHAQIVVKNGQVFIEDLNSTNGTLVNEKKIERAPLKDGDKIRLGSTTILKFTFFHDKFDETFQQQMFDAALRDGLTKTFNKRYLLERLENEFAFACRHQSQLSLLVFDVDHFKKFNDTYGHLVGDAVLVQLAQIVQANLRTEDVFGRYGGEEFVLICRDSSLTKSMLLAERLRNLIATTPFEYQNLNLQVTTSIGVSSLKESGAKTNLELLDAADKALYDAKKTGRNRVCSYEPRAGEPLGGGV